MTALVYPAMLAAPRSVVLRPTERRALSDLEAGSPQARQRQRDFLARLQCDWTYSAAQMEAWLAWHDTDLAGGLRWFSAPLPGRGGWLPRVVRYLGPVKRERLAGGHWRLSAELELRGVSAAPQA